MNWLEKLFLPSKEVEFKSWGKVVQAFGDKIYLGESVYGVENAYVTVPAAVARQVLQLHKLSNDFYTEAETESSCWIWRRDEHASRKAN